MAKETNLNAKYHQIDEAIASKYNYSSKNDIRTLFRNYQNFSALAEKGIIVAICIKADLDWATDFTGYHDGIFYPPLDQNDKRMIYGNLILGASQEHIGTIIGKSQSTVSNKIQYILSKVLVLLYEAGEIDNENYEDISNYYDFMTTDREFLESLRNYEEVS